MFSHPVVTSWLKFPRQKGLHRCSLFCGDAINIVCQHIDAALPPASERRPPGQIRFRLAHVQGRSATRLTGSLLTTTTQHQVGCSCSLPQLPEDAVLAPAGGRTRHHLRGHRPLPVQRASVPTGSPSVPVLRAPPAAGQSRSLPQLPGRASLLVLLRRVLAPQLVLNALEHLVQEQVLWRRGHAHRVRPSRSASTQHCTLLKHFSKKKDQIKKGYNSN